jgi:N6-adenosine-specific RNA methylase IME4
LPVSELANPDCVLFIWATYPMLPQALETISKWGFKYKSIAFQWVKLNKKNGRPFYGLGRWTRGNTEPCLLAVKGKPKRINNSVFQLIQTPIEGHSKKPDVAREKIIQLCGDLPRIELFARQRVPGWDAWGNQVGQPELTIEPAVE